MTVASFLSVASAVVAVFGGLFAWLANRMVFKRLDDLESSRDGMGARFGEGHKKTEIWQAQHDAVELHKQGKWPK